MKTKMKGCPKKRANSYGSIEVPSVNRSISDERGYYSSRDFFRGENQCEEATAADTLLQQQSASLPTVVFSDTVDSTPKSTPKRKNKRKMFMRRRKGTWPAGGYSKKHFVPVILVSPPYLFPAQDEISAMEEEEERKRSFSIKSHLLEEEELEEQEIGEKGEEVSGEKLPPLTKRQIFCVVMLATANFCSTVVFSCIAPFFPSEAMKKGVSQTVIGLIFGIFELCIFLTAPLYGRYMTHIGSKFMYGAGLFVTGVTSVLFGLLNMSPPGGTFIGLCFAIRICEAIGDSAFITASFAIIAHEFPGRTSTIIGLLETFSGLGFTAGPPIGGALYQLGGFQLPFIVLGCFLFLAGALSIPLIPKQDDAPRHKVGGVFRLFRIPAVFLMCTAIIVCAICLSFLDPTLQGHLKEVKLHCF